MFVQISNLNFIIENYDTFFPWRIRHRTPSSMSPKLSISANSKWLVLYSWYRITKKSYGCVLWISITTSTVIPYSNSSQIDPRKKCWSSDWSDEYGDAELTPPLWLFYTVWHTNMHLCAHTHRYQERRPLPCCYGYQCYKIHLWVHLAIWFSAPWLTSSTSWKLF